jgi:hypothetical protein
MIKYLVNSKFKITIIITKYLSKSLNFIHLLFFVQKEGEKFVAAGQCFPKKSRNLEVSSSSSKNGQISL